MNYISLSYQATATAHALLTYVRPCERRQIRELRNIFIFIEQLNVSRDLLYCIKRNYVCENIFTHLFKLIQLTWFFQAFLPACLPACLNLFHLHSLNCEQHDYFLCMEDAVNQTNNSTAAIAAGWLVCGIVGDN